MKGTTVLLTVVLATVATSGPPLEYRFSEVKSKVVIRHDGTQRRATEGDVGVAGDEVRTGWWGNAVVEVPEHASRFEILPSSVVTLAGSEPGVLVVLEKGRLRAIFDALKGDEKRLVATPGALLAVRGTRYGVEVDSDGSAAVAVFEGTVEVLPRMPGVAPLAVRAGELCRFGPRLAPHRSQLPPGTREDRWRGGFAGLGARGAPAGDQGRGRSPGAAAQPPQQRPSGRGQRPPGGG